MFGAVLVLTYLLKMTKLTVEQCEANWKKAVAELKSEFLGLLKAKDQKINQLQNKIEVLEKQVNKLEDSLDDADAASRLDQVVISGADIPLVQDNENTKAIVSDLLKSKLKLNCPQNDIVNATRLGPKPKTQKPDRRSILVTTSNRGAKQNIMSACKSVRPSFYVNENLTARRRTILYALRKIKKEHPNVVKGLTTFDGKVCVYIPQSAATTVDSPTSGNRTSAPGANVATAVDPRTSGNGLSTSGAQVGTRDKKILVNTHAGLVRFCNDVVKVPLDTFLAQWPH